MRILLAVPDEWMRDGLAHVLRAAVPAATLVDCGKHNLLLAADPAAGAVAAAVVAFPWHSLATLRALCRRQSAAVVVACTAAHDGATHTALLATKVAAVVPDSSPPGIVGAVVQVALHGTASVQPRALWQRSDCTEDDGRPQRRLGELNLTPRQFDVLRLVASGHPNKVIADELGIGLRTVKGHVAVILRALHADDRRAAGRNARRWLARHQTLVHMGAGAP
jgi:DNA-binding NarL/FixJ family response regulator